MKRHYGLEKGDRTAPFLEGECINHNDGISVQITPAPKAAHKGILILNREFLFLIPSEGEGGCFGRWSGFMGRGVDRGDVWGAHNRVGLLVR